MALSAATHDPYLVIQGGLIEVAGTSAGAPAFAGILALLNQHWGGRAGNPAGSLYSLASNYASTFHDVVTGTNAVPCALQSPSCVPGSLGWGTLAGWSAGAGFDLATGLGSVDAYSLVMNWPSSTPPVPIVVSLAPNPMTGSASNQTLTITGSGFQSGLNVVLSSSGSSTTYQGSQIISVTSTQVQVSVNVGTADADWSVQVTNSSGLDSNIAPLTVNGPLTQPVITSLSPNPMTGSSFAQTLTMSGSGFQIGSGLQVQLTSSGGATTTLQGSQIVYVSRSQLQVSVITGTAAASYLVRVVNPNGLTSAPANLAITAPAQRTSVPFLSATGLYGQPLYNYASDWRGMALTVGGSPLIVSALGRICAPGNILGHAVKFVNASDGSDVPGASASVSMAGCTVGQFVYSTITPITLAARTSYYLMSSEQNGGDQWYEASALSSTADAAVNGSVYLNGQNWIPQGPANTSYVPPNFLISLVTQYPLATVVIPATGGSISANPPSVDGYYNSGTIVQLTATPAPGCVFSAWSASPIITANPLTVTMSGAEIAVAVFQCNYLLTAGVAPLGSGSISANPPAVGGYYTSGTVVQLTATPASSCTFVGWSGSLNATINPLMVIMSNPQSFTANFQCNYPLTTSVSPPGSGSIAENPSGAAGYYNSGTAVQLTATPASGCTFTGWSGSATGTANPLGL